MDIKYTFLGISKRLLYSLIIIVQIATSLVFLTLSFELKHDLKKGVTQMNSFYSDKEFYVFEDFDETQTIINEFSDLELNKNLSESYTYLTESDEFDYVTGEVGTLFLEENQISRTITTKYNEMRTRSVSRDNQSYVLYNNNLYVNYKFLRHFDYNIIEGSSLSKEDFELENNLEIPILVGENLKEYYSLGDVINYSDAWSNSKGKYIVKGFINSEAFYIPTNSLYGELKGADVSSVFIIPIQKNLTEFDSNDENSIVQNAMKIRNNLLSSYIIPADNQDIDRIIYDIEGKIRQSFNFRLKNVDYYIDYISSLRSNLFKYYDIIFLIIILFSGAGIILSTLNHINKRTTEYGIHIMTGCTLFRLSARIVMELAYLIITSTFLSEIILRLFLQKSIVSDYNILLNIIIFQLSFLLMVSILPVLRIYKMGINEMIRRKE